MDCKGIQPYIHRCPLSPKLLSSYKSHFIGHPVPGIVQGLEKVKEKKRLGLELCNMKGIHVKKKCNCINAKTIWEQVIEMIWAWLWSMNTPWFLEMHVAGKQINSIHPASQLPNFGVKVHLSLCPFQVLWSVSPKMECPGRWLWQLCYPPVSLRNNRWQVKISRGAFLLITLSINSVAMGWVYYEPSPVLNMQRALFHCIHATGRRGGVAGHPGIRGKIALVVK